MMWFGVGNYMFYSIAIIYPAVNDVLYLLVAFISVLAVRITDHDDRHVLTTMLGSADHWYIAA
jgi:type IV secretory pathway VirB3-like protein